MHKLIQRLRPPSTDTGEQEPPHDADSHEHPGVPRWVKISVGIVLAFVLMLVISELLGVKHGPGRHGALAASASTAASADELG